jgi:single-strand DNA-binding protein
MSRSLNKVMLIGNVGNEPEIRATGSGARVAKVSLATNRSFQDRSGQQQERTEWHRLTFFGRLADIVEQYVHKGDRLYAEGRIEYSQTQDEQGGTRYWTDIVVNEMVMLGSGGVESGGGGGYDRRPVAEPQSATTAISQPDDDLPF